MFIKYLNVQEWENENCVNFSSEKSLRESNSSNLALVSKCYQVCIEPIAIRIANDLCNRSMFTQLEYSDSVSVCQISNRFSILWLIEEENWQSTYAIPSDFTGFYNKITSM